MLPQHPPVITLPLVKYVPYTLVPWEGVVKVNHPPLCDVKHPRVNVKITLAKRPP